MKYIGLFLFGYGMVFFIILAGGIYVFGALPTDWSVYARGFHFFMSVACGLAALVWHSG